MKAAESKMLLDPSLHPMARSLYLALRHCASYSTGIVKISTSKMADLIRFEPPARSKAEAILPTRKQIRVWLETLENAGLIKLQKNGTNVEFTAWFLPFLQAVNEQQNQEMTGAADLSQSGAAANPYAPRVSVRTRAAKNATRGAAQGPQMGRSQGPQQSQTHQGFQESEGPSDFNEKGRIISVKIKDKSNIYNAHACENFQTDGWDLTTEQSPSTPTPQTGEMVDDDEPFPAPINPITTKAPISPTGAFTAEQLILDSELRATARIVGLTMPADQLDLVFIDFQSNKHNRYKCQGRADWIADWRSWCAKSKLFHARSQGNATTNQHSGFSKNSQLSDSAKVYAFVRAEAEKYASGDER